MNKGFFEKNRQNMLEKVKDNSVVVIFAGEAPQKSADENYSFTPNRNFYYLTGINREKMILMITKINNKVQQTLFIEKSDPVMAKWIGERMSPAEASEISGIDSINYLESFEGTLNRFLSNYEVNHLYLDLERREWSSIPTVAQLFAKDVNDKYPYLRIKDVYHILSELRMVKSEEEIEITRKAIDITYEGIKNLMRNVKPGMIECQAEAYFDFVLKSSGVTDYAFKTIAASGINGTVLHYSENNSQIKDGDLLLLDLGAQWNYYNADISFTFPVNGKFTDRQKQIYNIVLKALRETTKAIKPGVPYQRLNEITKEVLSEGLKEIGLIKDNSEIGKYYYHNVSHHLGLDTHDVGSREVELKEGMLLTVEPGLYISEEGIGIRIEDDVLVTKDGHEVLSKDVMRTVEEIEDFMSKR